MVSINIQTQADIEEIEKFIEQAFDELDSDAQDKFDQAGNGQSVDEWFSTEAVMEYLDKGKLIEARNVKNKLIGLAFVGMQNPISWPDGNKAELFVIAVDRKYRGQGIGKQLLQKVEQAAKDMGSRKLIINVHVFQTKTHDWYLKQGYTEIGILKDYYDNGDAKFFCKRF